MSHITKWLVYALALIAWGFLISIGFWLGHKVTNRVDQAINNKKGERIANNVAKQTAAELDPQF